MIAFYSGTPGSGKSLYASGQIVHAMRKHRNVICNYPVDVVPLFVGRSKGKRRKKILSKLPICKCINNVDLTPQMLRDFARDYHDRRREHQTLVVIDEAGVVFNSRTFKDTSRLSWIELFSQHRKLGFDFIMIAQSDNMIDKQIRSLIETEYKFRNIRHYKFFGLLLSLFAGGLFIKTEYWYASRLKCSTEFFRYNKSWAGIYDTYALFDAK